MKVTLNCITKPCMDMSVEEYLIYAARISSKDRVNHETAPKLMRYLIEHGHWSPFEMISIGVEIETSRAIAQQILRHRSFSFQEFSQRYASATELEPVELRKQAVSNRQSSSDVIESEFYDCMIQDHMDNCLNLYESLLEQGVAREVARMVLPLTTKTTMVMHGTLRSWMHFFDQRCSEHAQKEVRDIAFECRRLISVEFPWTASALGWDI